MVKIIQRTILVLFCSALLVVATYSGYKVYTLSNERAEIKKDYSLINNITYGLLSVNAWRDHLISVVTHRIDDFEFTPAQEDTLKRELEQVLHAVLYKAENMVDQKQKSVGGKLKKFAVKTFVNEDKLHAKVPVFAKTIVDEVKKPKNRERIKYLAKSKLEEVGSITYDSANDIHRIENVLAKYDSEDVTSFNEKAEVMLSGLKEKSYFFTYLLIGVLLVFLAMWWILKNFKALYTPLFVMSVLLALIVLGTGLTTPMIEIDARIKEMSFVLIGQKISFNDQVIFFQSKSIVDVVHILIQTGKYDSMIVGLLIMAFSILFPIGKLLATKLYLLGSDRWKTNKLIRFFAFKSGKWSMADVNVVAIFMAYIGFKGILDNQLGNLNMKTESLASISTNETTLQPGFILFVCFVLFSLLLSVILKYITEPRPEKQTVLNKGISPSVA